VFVRLGDVVRALRALEARGGSARLALFERTWGPYAYAALGLALEWGLAERRGDVYRLSGRGRRLLRELDGCPVEARAVRGRLLLETPFGEYAVEPTAGGLLSVAYKLAEACRERPQEVHRRIVEEAAKAIERAPGLERWLLAFKQPWEDRRG